MLLISRSEYFVPVCKSVQEYLTFHLGSDFGLFWVISAILANFGQDEDFDWYQILPIFFFKKKKLNSSFWASLFLLQLHPCLFEPPHFSVVNISFVREHLLVGHVRVQPCLCEEAFRPKKALKKKKNLRICWGGPTLVKSIIYKGFLCL